MVVRCCMPLDGCRCAAWVRACDARVLGYAFLGRWRPCAESLLVGLCFIRCLITTKSNFAIIIDRDVVMHHKI